MPNIPQAEGPVAEQTIRPANPNQEYWKPILNNRETLADQAKSCASCGKDFVAGANFCHTCGVPRRNQTRDHDDLTLSGAARPVLQMLASSFFAAGLAFALVATVLGSIYAPTDFERWQALQSWRTEWLLGAAVAFLASLCLRLDRPRKS